MSLPLRVSLSAHPELGVVGGAHYFPEADCWLVRGKRRLRAFSATCPHKPDRGRLEVVNESKRCFFRCSDHGWTFSRKGRPSGKAKARLTELRVTLDGESLVVG